MNKTRIVAIVVICVALIVGGFALWMNKTGNASSENMELTKVQQLMTKDLEKNYPKTPREVVKNFIEITTCYYNEEYTEKELEALVVQARTLMDDELAANNPKDDYIKGVKEEALEYKAAGRSIVSYTLASSNDVEYLTVDDRECAYVKASYFINEGGEFSKTHQMYVVRKDENGNWKILVFYKIEGDTSDGE